MTNRIRIRTKQDAPKGSTRAKGDFVERIIASMHETPGVKVERNIFLPVEDGSGRTREIDVLLTSQVAGYPVQVAIECKNEKTSVGIEVIDEFIGKLQDVGIPIQLGIFVSASGYKRGAIFRAKKAGIKPLVLKDITESLPTTVQAAFQSLIYLLLTIINIKVHNDVAQTAHAEEMLYFRGEDGKICGTIQDLIWQDWISGKISDKLGDYKIDVSLPDGWSQVVDGRKAQVHGIEVKVRVTGHVITLTGKVSQMSLIDAISHNPERNQIKAEFLTPSAKYPVFAFTSEDDLSKYIHQAKGITISIGHFRIPRIIWNAMYWPPSESSFRKIVALMQAFADGKIPDPRPFNFGDIEGDDLSKAWEPIWSEHPLAKKSTKENGGG